MAESARAAPQAGATERVSERGQPGGTRASDGTRRCRGGAAPAPAGDPGEQVLVALVEQRLVAIELGAVKPGQMSGGELAEQEIALQPAAIAATMQEPLAPDLDRLAHARAPPVLMRQGCTGRRPRNATAGDARPPIRWRRCSRRRAGSPASGRGSSGRWPGCSGCPRAASRAASTCSGTCRTALIDRALLASPAAAAAGELVTLLAGSSGTSPPRGARRPYRIRCASALGRLELVFFGARRATCARSFPGRRARRHGRLGRYGERWQIAHPELIATPRRRAARAARAGLPADRGAEQAGCRAARAAGAGRAAGAARVAGPAWLQARGWPSLAEALRRLHQPGGRPRARARRAGAPAPRLRRAARQPAGAGAGAAHRAAAARPRARGRRPPRRPVAAALPFRLTACQQRVLAEIRADLARPAPMLRLLQGDVGSGKTVVALPRCCSAVEAGAQAALMAPTEVLARQHAATLARLLAPAGLAPALLTGREPAGAPARARAASPSGASPIAVGTHALFQDGVAFGDLGLAVVDEQHRFGVGQRLELAGQGRGGRRAADDRDADPAHAGAGALRRPRRLAAARASRPGGSRPDPRGAARADRRVLAAVERWLAAGERIYWICPLIGDGEGERRRRGRGGASATGSSRSASGRWSGWSTAACRRPTRPRRSRRSPPARSGCWSRPR